MASQKASICAFCDRIYNNPRILPCLHSFCHECIVQIQEDGSVTCPNCHEAVVLAQGHVSSLPFNIQLKTKAEQDRISLKATSSSPVPCDSCKAGEKIKPHHSVAYCRDCEDFLCEVCWRAHQIVKLTRSHSSCLLKESSGSFYEMDQSKSLAKCFLHESLALKYYCIECCVPICAECLFSHKSHQVSELAEQVADCKAMMHTSNIKLEANTGNVESALSAINERKKKVQLRKQKIENMIKQSFSQLQEAIREREKAMLHDCNQLVTATETRLSIQQEDLQTLLDRINQCCSMSSIATSEYNDAQLLSVAQTILKRATSLQERLANTPTDVCETADITARMNTATLVSMVKVFGCLADNSPCGASTTAVIPRTQLGLKVEMKVTVVSRDKSGEQIIEGGSAVRGVLTSSDGKCVECAVIDNGDGTYVSSVQPMKLGKHELKFSINGMEIQDSPFCLNVVQRHSYTHHMTSHMMDINSPNHIAFSNDGDMFVTVDSCIHVYNRKCQKKATIELKKTISNNPHFSVLRGLAIVNDIVYVADYGSNKIHKLTTGGEFLDSIGEEGIGHGQFTNPYAVAVSPEKKIYVSDCGRRVQVFNPDWSLSHVIDGGGRVVLRDPEGLAFDLSGNIHIACRISNSIIVYSPNGDFVGQYGKDCLSGPGDIAIDSSGCSIVANYFSDSLSILDLTRKKVLSVKTCKSGWGVAISPYDYSIWLADRINNKLLRIKSQPA